MSECRPDPRATGLRRAALLVVLVAVLIGGSAWPSWAGYTDAARVDTTIATATIAPPTALTARARCQGNTATVTVDWAASTSERVSGYRVRLYLNSSWQDQATVGPAATTWQGTTDTYYVTNYTMTFSVWTLTQHGWAAESVRTARVVC